MAKTLTYEAVDTEAVTRSIYVCGICGHLMGERKDLADQCCTCSQCHQPIEGNGSPGGHRSAHPACETKRAAEAEARQIERAEKIDTWEGPVYYEDEFYQDLGALTDHLEDSLVSEKDWPAYVFVCDEERFPLFDLDNVIQNLSENHGIEDYDGPNISKETMALLQAAVQRFDDETKNDISWHPNFHKMVRVPAWDPEVEFPK